MSSEQLGWAALTGQSFEDYVVFLALAFHGPSHWTDDKGLEFGGFISHFPFAAGMLFAAAHGPRRLHALKQNIISR